MKDVARVVGMFLLFISSACVKEAVECMNINVLVAVRDSQISAYAEINKGEIYLVFAQLAKTLPGSDAQGMRRVIQEKEFQDSSAIIKEQILSIFDSTQKTITVASDKPTLILFNEMFFGRDRALEKKGVDFIVDCYKEFSGFFKNTYLYIDFLYKDDIHQEYSEQIDISKSRYSQIYNLEAKNDRFSGFSSIWFQMGIPPNYTSLNRWYLELTNVREVSDSQFSGLLFNQIKVFFEGVEIGFYNKSSFCGESLPDFINGNELKKKVPFYVIGDFSIHWIKEHDPLLDNITSLICYDTDAILNLDDQPSPKQVCLFVCVQYI